MTVSQVDTPTLGWGTAVRRSRRRWILSVKRMFGRRFKQAKSFWCRNARSSRPRLAIWAIKRGLTQHVHPHMLRHSFASHVLQSSGDLRAVQEMLGHASIASTQVYTHLDFQYLAKVYDETHPRAKAKARRKDAKDQK